MERIFHHFLSVFIEANKKNLLEGGSPTLRKQCVWKNLGFTFNGNISRPHIWTDGIHLSDLGTNILAGNFIDFLNSFVLCKSSEYS